jgi:hypothetical protein
MLDDLCDAVDPDPAWLPGTKRLEIVDKEGQLAKACHNILVFARGLELVTANVEACAIELEAHGINGRLFLVVPRCPRWQSWQGVALAGKPVLALKTSHTSFLVAIATVRRKAGSAGSP